MAKNPKPIRQFKRRFMRNLKRNPKVVTITLPWRNP